MISIKDLTKLEIESLLRNARLYREKGAPTISQGCRVGLIFAEPSTRTAMSFEEALRELRLRYIDLDMSRSSVLKGESLDDTIRMMELYCSILIVRTSTELTSKSSKHTLINAGDGTNEHPTQALIDLLTLEDALGRSYKNVCVLGDAKNSRAIHSFLYCITSMRSDLSVTVVAPADLQLPDQVHRAIWGQGSAHSHIRKVESLDQVDAKIIDVLYVTRKHKEREQDCLPESDYPIVTPEFVNSLKETAVILHPLPRQAELPVSIDRDKRAHYMKQARNALPMRIAIIERVLGKMNHVHDSIENVLSILGIV